MVAGRYTLLEYSAAEELLPLCAERDVTVLAAGIFNSGILSQPKPGAHYDYKPASQALVDRARHLRDCFARHDISMPAAAQAFALKHPAVPASW